MKEKGRRGKADNFRSSRLDLVFVPIVKTNIATRASLNL